MKPLRGEPRYVREALLDRERSAGYRSAMALDIAELCICGEKEYFSKLDTGLIYPVLVRGRRIRFEVLLSLFYLDDERLNYIKHCGFYGFEPD